MDSLLIVHRVGPHEITEDTIEWDFLLTIDFVNLVELLEPGRNTAVHRQVLLGDVAANWHRVKALHKQVVHLRVEALQDLVPERESLSHVA